VKKMLFQSFKSFKPFKSFHKKNRTGKG